MPCFSFSHQGSPPLTRGIDNVLLVFVRHVGITPACAGNSFFFLRYAFRCWDHPCLRGEQAVAARFRAAAGGSPPLTRGIDIGGVRSRLIRGITPAYAGNRTGYVRRYCKEQDHPRLRGEQRQIRNNQNRAVGSPPLTRGTAAFRQQKRGGTGITPAYAGNSPLNDCCITYTEDHPRLRGEQETWRRCGRCCRRSPPLTRGTVLTTCINARKQGITPAYAGNSSRFG